MLVSLKYKENIYQYMEKRSNLVNQITLIILNVLTGFLATLSVTILYLYYTWESNPLKTIIAGILLYIGIKYYYKKYQKSSSYKIV